MKFTIEIASLPDREGLVAEIWQGDAMVAELHHGTAENVEIEIYAPDSRTTWSFDFAIWVDVLLEARRKLG